METFISLLLIIIVIIVQGYISELHNDSLHDDLVEKLEALNLDSDKFKLEKQGEKLPAGFYYVNSEGKKFYSDTFKYGNVILHVEKQSNLKSATVDVDSMVESYKQRLWKQCKTTGDYAFVNACAAAFREGVENTLDELDLRNFINKSKEND